MRAEENQESVASQKPREKKFKAKWGREEGKGAGQEEVVPRNVLLAGGQGKRW